MHWDGQQSFFNYFSFSSFLVTGEECLTRSKSSMIEKLSISCREIVSFQGLLENVYPIHPYFRSHSFTWT